MTTKGVGTPSGPRVLASRSLRPECYRGDLANSKILAVMSLFGFLLLRNSAVSIPAALMSRWERG